MPASQANEVGDVAGRIRIGRAELLSHSVESHRGGVVELTPVPLESETGGLAVVKMA